VPFSHKPLATQESPYTPLWRVLSVGRSAIGLADNRQRGGEVGRSKRTKNPAGADCRTAGMTDFESKVSGDQRGRFFFAAFFLRRSTASGLMRFALSMISASFNDDILLTFLAVFRMLASICCGFGGANCCSSSTAGIRMTPWVGLTKFRECTQDSEHRFERGRGD
jgi:hypothetical protein